MDTKKIVIGNMEFSVAINRDIVKQAFEKVPKLERLIELQSVDSNKMNIHEMLELNELMFETMELAIKVMLPQMLRLASTELFGNKSYDDYSSAIIEYAKQEDVFFPYIEEVDFTERNEKGVTTETDEDGNIVYVRQRNGFAFGLFEYAMSVFHQNKLRKAHTRLVM